MAPPVPEYLSPLRWRWILLTTRRQDVFDRVNESHSDSEIGSHCLGIEVESHLSRPV